MKIKMFFCSLIALLLLFVGCSSEKQTMNETLTKQTVSISTDDNSMTSLDWAGTYNGTLPSAGYGGISTTLILHKDLTYKLLIIYLSKSDQAFESNGNFVWNNEGSIITLLDDSSEWNQQYKVEENRLLHLDIDGNKITGDLASMYILLKINTDWIGTYNGTLPCADCEGISTTLILNEDFTYKLLTIYLGKSDQAFESNGNFVWNNEGTTITLFDESNESKQQYEVAGNRLFHLDINGTRINSNFASMYILLKSGSEITEKYWKLVELMGKEVVRDEQMQKDPHIIFRTQDNRVNGYAGCNSFSGSYEIQEGYRLRISSVAMTQMACLDMTIETEFVRVLNTTDSYLVKGDTLFLYRARMAPLARFEALYLD